MCELLVFVKNNSHPDTEKDRSGAYKRGMVVEVHADGHRWGKFESLRQWIADGNPRDMWPRKGVFAILKVPGLPEEKVRPLLDTQMTDDDGVVTLVPGSMVFAGGPVRQRFRRRMWRLDLDNLPAGLQDSLDRNAEITVAASRLRGRIMRIRDGEPFEGIE